MCIVLNFIAIEVFPSPPLSSYLDDNYILTIVSQLLQSNAHHWFSWCRSTSVTTVNISHDTPSVCKLCMRVYVSWLPIAHSCRELFDGQKHENSTRGRFVWAIARHYVIAHANFKDTFPSDRSIGWRFWIDYNRSLFLFSYKYEMLAITVSTSRIWKYASCLISSLILCEHALK